MELQEVIDYAKSKYKTDLAKQIAENLVLLGVANTAYAKKGKYSFNHGIIVGKCEAYTWVLEQLEAQSTES